MMARRPHLVLLLCLLIGVPLAAGGAAAWVGRAARAGLDAAAHGQLALYGANLASELERHSVVPFVLAQDAEVHALLQDPDDAGRVDRLNRRLEAIAGTAGAAAVYVMDREGTTLAASNWNTETSFQGQNFAFRPYFQEAMSGGIGRSFALGTASGVPGYYIAYPVPTAGIEGVVVVKVVLDTLERTWAQGGERVAVTDRHGIIIVTNTADWRFRTLAPLPPPVLAKVEASLQYRGARIEPLPVLGRTADELVLDAPLDAETEGAPRPAVRHLVRSGPVPGTDWTLHVLLATAPVARLRADAAVIAGFAVVILGFAGYHGFQRRLSLAERLEYQRSAQADLEERVRARTADLSAAQSELVQAAKLAALGQMSAGIAHELNQPLAAIRTYADNGVVLLERNRPDAARANLAGIAELTERMARITRQLNAFARKSAGVLEPVGVQDAVERALALMAASLRAERIAVVRAWPDAPVWVRGEDVRLQQVLINLVRNAVDAMKGAPRRELAIGLTESGGDVVLTLRDTGSGIAGSDIQNLFLPFFTTKPAGEGLGLGLSISCGILRDFGGAIAAANHPEGGAMFTITLRRAQPAE